MSTQPESSPVKSGKTLTVKIIGLGGAGGALVDALLREHMPGASFAVIDVEEAALARSNAPEKLCLQSSPLRGFGTGGDPDLGKAAAESCAEKLKSLCADMDVVFLLGGLGGGTASGVGPVLVRAAKESGAFVLAFASLPFDCEGSRRRQQALAALEKLKSAADGVIALHNQKVFKLIDENTTVRETFETTGRLLLDGVRGVWRLLTCTGLIDIHFSDLCGVLRGRHAESSFAAVEASGPNRSREALDRLLGHPLLDNGQGLNDADVVLVSLLGGPDLKMADINRVMEQINRQCEKAQVIMGAAIDDQWTDRLAVIVIASRRAEVSTVKPAPVREEKEPASTGEGDSSELETQLLDSTAMGRSRTRIVPPPPELTAQKREQLLAAQMGASPRQRKRQQRFRQEQLPLEIISKGRFEKSEPTIHKGEDLDVPTYIRRGVVLN